MTRLALLAAVLAAGVGGCGDNEAPACTDGYNVCNGQIRDPEGRALVPATTASVTPL